MGPEGVMLRPGLPRVPGGEPWPNPNPGAALTMPVDRGQSGATHVELATPLTGVPSPAHGIGLPVAPPSESPAETILTADRALRRGLPRTTGAEPWPPLTPAPVFYPGEASTGETASPALDPTEPTPATASRHRSNRPDDAAPRGQAARYGRYTVRQWVGAGALLVIVLAGLAAVTVLLARWALTLEPVGDFVTRYPGEYYLPEGAPVGIPAWLAWQHFFNAFLMVLIIRSGWAVRTEKKPPAAWASRRPGAQKMSLTVWFHQSLDLLWLLNGALFVVLLLITGQWMRVVPTSVEVFPNAVSAILQYLSLDWPTENGWVNYNSLQQLAYFATIFLAAPLAAATGFRLSALWPTGAEKLSQLYPLRWARRLHFPVMLYFVVFIVVHVSLVLSTGALRNLNHMYAALGSADPTAVAENWTGFWMFVLSITVMAAAVIAARPIVLAPIARLFGTVTAR